MTMIGRSPSCNLLAALGGLLITSAVPTSAQADEIADLFESKRITITITCQRAGRGTWQLSLNAKKNLLFADGSGKPVELIDGTARTEFMHYEATVKGDELTITSDALKLSGVRFVDVVRIQGNTCSARHDVEPGKFGDSIDPTCKATNCTVASMKAKK
jgi:hypothetical protein